MPLRASKVPTVASTARVLIIAGSDSGGGAGIQADIKTVTMLGGHAMTAVTAITAQNTLGVTADPRGTGGNRSRPDRRGRRRHRRRRGEDRHDRQRLYRGSGRRAARAAEGRAAGASDRVRSGDGRDQRRQLADEATVAAFGRLMAVATLATPNLPELKRLTSEEDPVAAALHLVGEHGCAILIKGGHEEGDALADALIEEDNMTSWQGRRIDTDSTHGTGCTLASAITLFLAEGASLADAVARGREFVRVALHEAPGLGQGAGPIGHARYGSTSDRARASTRSPSPARITPARWISIAAWASSRSSTAPTPAMRGSRLRVE